MWGTPFVHFHWKWRNLLRRGEHAKIRTFSLQFRSQLDSFASIRLRHGRATVPCNSVISHGSRELHKAPASCRTSRLPIYPAPRELSSISRGSCLNVAAAPQFGRTPCSALTARPSSPFRVHGLQRRCRPAASAPRYSSLSRRNLRREEGSREAPQLGFLPQSQSSQSRAWCLRR